MVVIRLSRTGAKKQPFYHVVVADQRSPRDGKFIERVGYFNPVARGAAVRLQLDNALVEQWISKGAQPSERVGQLIVEFNQASTGIEKRNSIRGKRADKKAKAAITAAAPAEETPAADAEDSAA